VTRPEPRPTLSLPYRLRARDDHAAEHAAAGAPPLLVLLHGRGGNELAMAALADQFDRRFVVVSPRAPIEAGPYAYQWFPEAFTPEGPRVRSDDLAAAVATLQSFVGEVVGTFRTDPARVHLTGFSQGGTLALSALLTDPARIAAAVSMSGWLPPAAIETATAAERLAGMPVLVLHGRDDRTIDPRLGREAHASLSALGLAAELREPPIGHTTTTETIAEASAWLSGLLDRGGPAS
jgi:phospholipase/carboxylesterase